MVNKLILGTVQFGLNYGINNTVGKLSENQVFKIFNSALEFGITTLDTAEAYGNAHDIISNFHKQTKERFNIITKYSSVSTGYPEDFISRINLHCKNFDVDFLEAYMFHSFSDFKNSIKNDPKLLEKINSSGLVKKIGVSVYTNEEIEYLFNYKDIGLIQLPFNLFDNEFQRRKILERAKNRNIEIHTRSTFLQGLFFKEVSKLNDVLSPLKKDLDNLRLLSNKNKIGMTNLALNYSLSKAYIDKVLIGVDSEEQLVNNIKVSEQEIEKGVHEIIDTIKIKNNNLLNPSNWKI